MDRKIILEACYATMGAIEDNLTELELSEDEKVEANIEELSAKLSELEKLYLNSLPATNISRCPYTGEIVSMAIDIYGIDGLWWNNSTPVRDRQNMPGSLICLDGALKLASEIEKTPFLVMPGPDKPFVIPDLLQRDDVKAVMSSVGIGKHTGFIIAYYSDDPLDNPDRTNDWGAEYFIFTDEEGIERTLNSPYNWLDYDYELMPWIQRGKLFWISPNDHTLTLKSVVKTCPYLNLEGRGEIQLIIDSRVELLGELEDGEAPELEEILNNLSEEEKAYFLDD